MKIQVPGDYQEAFSKAITIALLVEGGQFSAAFKEVGHDDLAYKNAEQWGMGGTLRDREAILTRCENRLGISGYVAEASIMAELQALKDQIDQLPTTGVLTVDDKGAGKLREALESYTRLGLGQVDQVLENFSFSRGVRNIREQDAEVINDMRHLAITRGGASFGITNTLVSDDVRNAWMARKFIDLHLSYKRNPKGSSAQAFDTPMRLGSCSNQDIVIDDPEFTLPSKKVREATRWSKPECNF